MAAYQCLHCEEIEQYDDRGVSVVCCDKQDLFCINYMPGEILGLRALVAKLEAAALHTPVPKGYVLVSEEALRSLGVLDAINASAAYPLGEQGAPQTKVLSAKPTPDGKHLIVNYGPANPKT